MRINYTIIAYFAFCVQGTVGETFVKIVTCCTAVLKHALRARLPGICRYYTGLPGNIELGGRWAKDGKCPPYEKLTYA